MQRHLLYTAAWCLPLFVVLTQAPAFAAPEPVAPPPFASEPVPVFAMPAAVRLADARFGVAARSDQLDAQRGGTDTVNNNMQLEGGVHDNVANHVVTGANSIDSGSFANMAGIPTVIQNSGANVLIQNATIINLQFK